VGRAGQGRRRSRGEAGLTESNVIGHVEASLAGFKKPREVEFRDELPRNPTGKVLKNELA